MATKPLPRYKSNRYFAKFTIDWLDEDKIFSGEDEKALIKMFKDSGELTLESEVGIKSRFPSISAKDKVVYWQRKTGEGNESVILGDLKPDEIFLHFLNKFFARWCGGYRKTKYCIIKAICKLYQKDPEEFVEMADKAKNLEEFIGLMGIK